MARTSYENRQAKYDDFYNSNVEKIERYSEKLEEEVNPNKKLKIYDKLIKMAEDLYDKCLLKESKDAELFPYSNSALDEIEHYKSEKDYYLDVEYEDELEEINSNKKSKKKRKSKDIIDEPIEYDDQSFFTGEFNYIHSLPEQISRQERAMNLTVYDIDKEAQMGLINDYHVTLEECTCPDFQYNQARKKPCKHMYRLAMELGLFPYSTLYKPIDISNVNYSNDSYINKPKNEYKEIREYDFDIIDNQVAMTQESVMDLLNIDINKLREISSKIGIKNTKREIYERNGKYYYASPTIVFAVRNMNDKKSANLSSTDIIKEFNKAEDRLLPKEIVQVKRKEENRNLIIVAAAILILILVIYVYNK